MPEATSEQISARLKQFDSAVKSILSEGGSVIAGIVTDKNNWPAKEGRSATWSVVLSYFGGSSRVSVSQRVYDSIGIGSYHLFHVSQRASSNSIYSTAVEF